MDKLILVLTLAMTIIPFTGKLWKIKHSKLKIFLRGWIFIVISIFALTFGIIELNKQSKKQISRDENQINTFNNTKILITNLDSSVDAIEQKLLRIDSLNVKLDSLESKTKVSIEKRDNVLSDFNSLNKKLEKIYIQEESKILENIPIVKILDNVEYVINNGDYKIQVLFSNTGGRAAQNLNFDIWFFLTNQNGQIISHKLLSNDLQNEDDFPPTKITNKKIQILTPNFPKLNPNDSLSPGYLLVKYSYNDFVLDTTFYKKEEYIWRSTKLDGKKWISMPKSYLIQLEKYIELKKINI